ncbi:hypothetical protein Srubr_80840 [Streptomyces rubradiris]|uniref:Transposase n=1 Tax=Streptomyces rubradiris TaxID=285531 RepID=A0ABQ3RQV7_STRRR|nr:hypothetical protein GCM10018792_62810 [Streptomyces rubradiris]GHI58238.1 hypothetical protein Srubr_80840 [Streptomyces rubradiris]
MWPASTSPSAGLGIAEPQAEGDQWCSVRPAEPGSEKGQTMKKFPAKWRDRAWWHEALKTTARWVVSGAVRELGRWALDMWLR